MAVRAPSPLDDIDAALGIEWAISSSGAVRHAYHRGPGMGDKSLCGRGEFPGRRYEFYGVPPCQYCRKRLAKLSQMQPTASRRTVEAVCGPLSVSIDLDTQKVRVNASRGRTGDMVEQICITKAEAITLRQMLGDVLNHTSIGVKP